MTTTMQEPEITQGLIESHGITPEEYERICSLLGREPNFTELGIFSVMWSEHCSYKNSRPVLKLFPREGKSLLVKAGEENAGVVDIGDGLAICFKIESHNHPSAVEPFQGAATGVGGIIRDIFTMGARPILSMNSLRFGSLEKAQNKHYLSGVVAGIAHYGNCIGIPTIGGEIYFDDSYEGNPLVNAFCLGIMRREDLVKGSAKGSGNLVYYVGATTGRDGLGGAAFASRELTEESHEDRPAVQVGDPFMEKLLMEACLELSKTDAIVGMQDMGAAGLTCSTCETASRGSCGIEIDLAKVPRRETGMIPYEIMLSESQERMLIIVKRGKERVVEGIFEKWDLHAVKLGEVRDGKAMRIFEDGKCVAEIPAKALTDEAPVYNREMKEPEYLKHTRNPDLSKMKEPKDFSETLLKLLDHPTIASKAWIYQQYDHMVRTDTVFLPGHDAALVRIKGTKKGIAISTDCNGLYCYLDPFEGGKIAVAEAARNVACSGAKPLAITNCLNFGNPMKPEIFWQFRKAVEGMSEACRALETPVTGGNVSFYNESPKGAIDPTPTIGMVGILEDINDRIPSFFQNVCDKIFLLGETFEELGGSQYLLLEHGLRMGMPPQLDLKKEKALYDLILACAKERVLNSCHDLSEGGLAVALSECILGKTNHPLGARVNLGFGQNLRRDALLFGETQSRVVVSVSAKQEGMLEALAKKYGVPCFKIGEVVSSGFEINSLIRLTSEQIEKTYRNAIPRRMK
ncbi:MAG: phosphoribosylformylglycinamidine synthase subunit PurL [Candidatus Omnitrophica bacterium]|nr:phosphoribosylformylglycinamidine synthase subunit PurL [Candidatus Omnitrophota bacterium]